jgi:hypothetical protein
MKEYKGVMSAGEIDIKEGILLTRLKYSVLKEVIKDDDTSGCSLENPKFNKP